MNLPATEPQRGGGTGGGGQLSRACPRGQRVRQVNVCTVLYLRNYCTVTGLNSFM